MQSTLLLLLQNVGHTHRENSILLPNHRESFTCAGLTVGQNTAIIAVEYALNNGLADYVKHVLLRVLFVLENPVKVEASFLEVPLY